MRVLVTGGTGKTGKRVAERLRDLGHEPVVAGRSGDGADHVRFDWTDERTHAAAADGIEAAYLLAPAGIFEFVPAMRPFMERLIDRGAGPLVLLSAASLPKGGPMMGAVHAWLEGNAPRWTVLRPSWFMQNFSEQQHRVTISEEDVRGILLGRRPEACGRCHTAAQRSESGPPPTCNHEGAGGLEKRRDGEAERRAFARNLLARLALFGVELKGDAQCPKPKVARNALNLMNRGKVLMYCAGRFSKSYAQAHQVS